MIKELLSNIGSFFIVTMSFMILFLIFARMCIVLLIMALDKQYITITINKSKQQEYDKTK